MTEAADRASPSAPPAAARNLPTAFRTISEVARSSTCPSMCCASGRPASRQIRPLKRGGGRRYYRPEDVALLRRIRELLYQPRLHHQGRAEAAARRRPDEPRPRRAAAAPRGRRRAGGADDRTASAPCSPSSSPCATCCAAARADAARLSVTGIAPVLSSFDRLRMRSFLDPKSQSS